MTTRVAIVGGTGKLGGIIREVVDHEEGYEVVATLSSRSQLAELDGADLVIDAVVEPENLRDEIIARLAAAATKDRGFSERRHGVPPV